MHITRWCVGAVGVFLLFDPVMCTAAGIGLGCLISVVTVCVSDWMLRCASFSPCAIYQLCSILPDASRQWFSRVMPNR